MLTYNNFNTRILSIPETLPQWESKRQAIVDLCNLSLGEGFARGDYAELAKLTLIYLNTSKEQTVTIVLVGNQISNIPAGPILAAGQLEKLKEFVQFIVYIYVPWCLVSPVPSSAPFNDLKMLSDIQVYKRINNTFAQGGFKGLGLQMWYLTEELIPLVLLSSQVDSTTKQLIAQKILSYEQLKSCSKR